MKAEYLWKSRIAGYLTKFIDSMRLAGYKFEAQERCLRQFDQYCFGHNVPEAVLPREAVEDFCYGDEYQSQSTRQSQLCVLRKLAVYMEKSGCQVFVPPMQKVSRRPRYQPYIYTEKELRDFFTQIDTWDHPARSKRTMVDSLLFRMLYGCGLRLMEALKLTVADVDLEEGILRIRQSKNNKDRLAPMSGSLTERCRQYSRIMHKLSSPDFYYFPGLHGDCYDKSTIYRRFREYLWKAPRFRRSGSLAPALR